MAVKLKNVLRGEVMSLIEALAGAPLVVEDPSGRVVYGCGGRPVSGGEPVTCDGRLLGYVRGDRAPLVAALLGHLAALAAEARALGRETLDKYKELTMLYAVTEEMAAGLEREEIARVVVDEAKRLIKNADHVSLLVPNVETGLLETVAASDGAFDGNRSPVGGFAGEVMRRGRGEIVNDVRDNPRCAGEPAAVRALVCAALKVKDRVTGVLRVANTSGAEYGAGDLKLLSALAFEAAVAIENARLAFIRETFGRFLSDEVVRRLLDSREGVRLGGEKVTVSIMMTDLRGFTPLSEKLAPEAVVAVINNYLKEMVEIIQKYGGTVLEFVGDAVMVVFGAPLPLDDHAARALACAVEMQSVMPEVNRWNAAHGHPAIEMGIGVNTGPVVVGNIGSEKRTKYGCVGSQVNLASRIESFAAGGQILAAAETVRSSGVPVKARGWREIHPKGFRTPVVVYDVEGLDAPYRP